MGEFLAQHGAGADAPLQGGEVEAPFHGEENDDPRQKASKVLGHGARDQVTVSMQVESGCRDLGLKPALLGADPTRVCGTTAEQLHHSALNTSAIPRRSNTPCLSSRRNP